jgi:hypothetical protein
LIWKYKLSIPVASIDISPWYKGKSQDLKDSPEKSQSVSTLATRAWPSTLAPSTISSQRVQEVESAILLFPALDLFRRFRSASRLSTKSQQSPRHPITISTYCQEWSTLPKDGLRKSIRCRSSRNFGLSGFIMRLLAGVLPIASLYVVGASDKQRGPRLDLPRRQICMSWNRTNHSTAIGRDYLVMSWHGGI